MSAYAEWVESHDACLARQATFIDQRLGKALAERPDPLITVCASGTSPRSEGSTVHALRVLVEQSFKSWEALATAAVSQVIKSTHVLPLNAGLSEVEQCRQALDHARGEYFLVLPPGTLPSPHMLWLLADAVSGDPAIVYTDSDRLDPIAGRVAPQLRTGWDPDLLLAGDGLGSVYAVRTDLARRLGGFQVGETLRAAILHLLLRVDVACRPSLIQHIPAVLWHTVGWFERADQVEADEVRAMVSAVLSEQGHQVILEPSPLLPTVLLVHWLPSSPPPPVSIIVPVRDRASLLARCADGVLHRTDYPALELLIVDNGSSEPDSLNLLAELVRDPRARVLSCPGPFNYSALNNRAVAQATGEIVVFLNNDTDVIGPDWLSELVGQVSRLEVGAAGAKLLYPDGRVQHCGLWLAPGVVGHQLRFADRHNPGPLGELAVSRTVLAVTGACLAMRKTVFLEVGGFDEDRFKVAFNDVDLCLRLGDYGYRVVCTPAAEMFHLESMSRGLDDTPIKHALAEAEFAQLSELWDALLDGDPFYNPHLKFQWNELTLSSSRFDTLTSTQANDLIGIEPNSPGNPNAEGTPRLLDRAVSRTRDARRQASQYRREAEALRSQLAMLNAAATKLETDVATLTADRVQLEAALERVTRSTTWKVSWPLRQLGAAFPSSYRGKVAGIAGRLWTRLSHGGRAGH